MIWKCKWDKLRKCDSCLCSAQHLPINTRKYRQERCFCFDNKAKRKNKKSTKPRKKKKWKNFLASLGARKNSFFSVCYMLFTKLCTFLNLCIMWLKDNEEKKFIFPIHLFIEPKSHVGAFIPYNIWSYS